MPNTRYMAKGTTKVYIVPTIASASLIPTAAEVNAGTKISTELAEITGFTFANAAIDTPDMETAFVSKIAGEDSVEDSSMTFYRRTTTNPVLAALPKGFVGYVVFFPTGLAGATPAAGDKADVWPANVASNAKQYTAGNEASKSMVKFTPTSPPGVDVVLT